MPVWCQMTDWRKNKTHLGSMIVIFASSRGCCCFAKFWMAATLSKVTIFSPFGGFTFSGSGLETDNGSANGSSSSSSSSTIESDESLPSCLSGFFKLVVAMIFGAILGRIFGMISRFSSIDFLTFLVLLTTTSWMSSSSSSEISWAAAAARADIAALRGLLRLRNKKKEL